MIASRPGIEGTNTSGIINDYQTTGDIRQDDAIEILPVLQSRSDAFRGLLALAQSLCQETAQKSDEIEEDDDIDKNGIKFRGY
ncbi:MAG: hypothetical protein R2864_10390 [Syntrophotaleaceae bacterium]